MFLQLFERAAHHEKNVSRVNGFAFGFSAALKFERGLQLRLKIVHASHGHFSFLHQLQQRRLHAAPAHIASDHVSSRSDLVDLVDVNDPELREVDVAIRLVDQLTHEIFHVAAHVAGLAELRRVRLYKRHLDKIGDVFDQIRFPNAGRADQDYVLFRVLDFLGAGCPFLFELGQILGVIVMIADRNRENLFRFLLLDHEPIKMRLDIPR